MTFVGLSNGATVVVFRRVIIMKNRSSKRAFGWSKIKNDIQLAAFDSKSIDFIFFVWEMMC